MKAGRAREHSRSAEPWPLDVGVSCEEERQGFTEAECNAGYHSVGRRSKWGGAGCRSKGTLFSVIRRVSSEDLR